jgi:hypothetical protein
MSNIVRKFTAAAVAMSLVTIPTATIAATPAAPVAAAPTVVAPPANAWLSLSAMTANSSSAAAAAAAQDDDGPGFPPIAPLVVILATIGVAIWILTKGDNDSDLDLPVSPD